MLRLFYTFFIILLLIFPLSACSSTVPPQCTQAIIGITDGWNSSHVSLTLVEKNASGRWQRVLGPIPGRLGRNGTAWGMGINATPAGYRKKEGDGRSPAGIFALGGLWVTNDTPVLHDPAIPYVKVGPADLWVTDPAYPKLHNRHIRLNHPARTPWELKEQMRQTDYPHSIKMLVHHNTVESVGKPIIGAGSSIFFHIWRRDGAAPTAGCTSMQEENLRAIIARLRARKNPVYILLPRAEYAKYREAWKLP